MSKLRLLCVTAHPDDEAGGFGGSLLLYHARGVETYVICLTPGQAASHRGGHQADEELAAARRQEFAASCQILNVTQGEVLDYPDAKLAYMDVYRVVGELVQRIRRIRPQVMVTFGPEGGVTAHPDHSMAGVAATMAFHWASRTNRYPEQLTDGLRPHQTQKLYYGTADFLLPDRQPVSLAPYSTTIDISAYLETKIQAFHAHTTQSPLFPIFEGRMRQQHSRELYHLAACSKPSSIRVETDLLDGIVGD
jgi:LmbE family N-acetylglucosaminyl deacetylase